MPQPGPGCNCCCPTQPTLIVDLTSSQAGACGASYGGSTLTVTRQSDGWTGSATFSGSTISFPTVDLPFNGGTYTIVVSTPYGECSTSATLAACESYSTFFYRPYAASHGCKYFPILGARFTWDGVCGTFSATTDSDGLACPNGLVCSADAGATVTFSMPPRYDDATANILAWQGIDPPTPSPDYVCSLNDLGWLCNLVVCRALTLVDPSGSTTLTYQTSGGMTAPDGTSISWGAGWVGQSAGPVGELNVPATYFLGAYVNSLTGLEDVALWGFQMTEGPFQWSFTPFELQNFPELYVCPEDGGFFINEGQISLGGNLRPGGWTVYSVVEACGGGSGSVFARGTGTDPRAAGWNGYSAGISISQSAVTVSLHVASGSGRSALASLWGVGGYGDWYQLQLSCQGTTIAVQVRRRSDLSYLQPDGSWAAIQAPCLSVTDSSVTGAGYMGVGLASSSTQLLESDNFSIPLGPFSGAVAESWDSSTAPALPTTTGFVYSGSLVTDGSAPLAPISSPNVLEAPLGRAGYAAYNSVDGSDGDCDPSAWFGASTPSYSYYSGGGGGLPASITVTFDGSAIWGSYAGQSLTLSYDAALGDYPSACLATVTDGGHCDGAGATEGLLTITLTQTSPGVVSATAQWTGGVAGSGCADGACEYYGTASDGAITQGGAAGTLAFGSMSYSAGGSGSFAPNPSWTAAASENFDGVTAPSLPAGWYFPNASATSTAVPSFGAISSPNALQSPAGVAAFNQMWSAGVDPGGGDVKVSASFGSEAMTTNGSNQLTVYARSSSQSYGAANLYWASLDYSLAGGLVVNLEKTVATVNSVLGTVSGAFTPGVWHTVYLTCVGTSVTVAVQRANDGYWLSATGAWQSAQTTCLSVTDADVTGAGYSGMSIYSQSDVAAYADNFSVSTRSATLSLTVPT